MKLKKEINKGKALKTSTLREVILVTFTHAERSEGLTKDLISEKAQKLFLCSSVVVAQEESLEIPGPNYHLAIRNTSASKHTAKKRIRYAFPDLDGDSINVSFPQSWATACSSCVKHD